MVRTHAVTLALALLLQRAAAQNCILSLDTVEGRELAVTDFSVPREYILCPNNEYMVGTLDFMNNIENGTEMIHARPNMHIKCGNDGKRENSCIISGGSVHIDGTPFFGVGSNLTVHNFTVSGLTFEAASRHSVWINKPGNVVFNDCEFRDNVETTSPIYTDFTSNDGSDELSVTFEKSLFSGNVYSAPPAQPSVVVGNGISNRLTFQNCEFTNNTIIREYPRQGSLIETSGPLTVQASCFVDNRVAHSPIISYITEPTVENNYESNSAGVVCPLASFISTSASINSPRCSAADSAFCQADTTLAPTASPTISLSPTSVPQTSQPSGSATSSNLDDTSGGLMVGDATWKLLGALLSMVLLAV